MADELPVVRVGDRFRISVEVHRESVAADAGIMSPCVRVKEIRRDESGTLEVIVAPVLDEAEP